MTILKKDKEQMIEFLETNEKLINRPFATKTTKGLYEDYLDDRRK
jgi:arsenate reductase-like glutaredoxin family protein